MKFDLNDCVQRGHNYGIVDEVDSILIDEARTPLIISGASEESTDKYYKVNRIIPQLELGEEIDRGAGEDKILTGDYVVDEKHRTITVTDKGWEKVERLLGIGNIADPGELGPEAPRRYRDQGACAVSSRCGVRGQGRRGAHRR